MDHLPGRVRFLLAVAFLVASVVPTLSCNSDSSGDNMGDDGITTVSVPVPFYYQETQVWCWAATTSMVLAYYGAVVPQCEIVSRTLGIDCCFWGPPQCVTTGPIEAMMAALQYHASLYPYRAYRPLSFLEVKDQIDAGRPFIVSYSGSFGGHVVVVYGYDTANNLLVHDPINGTFVVPYGLTFVYAGSMTWTDTILVSRK